MNLRERWLGRRRAAQLEQTAVVVGTTATGLVVLAAAAGEARGASWALVMLLTAAAVAAESLQVGGDDDLPGEGHTNPFSFSLGVHVAAVVIVGGAAAVLVAAAGVVLADGLRGAAVRPLLFNASVFAIATAFGGVAFTAAGGEVGTVDLPADAGALLALAIAIYGVNVSLVSAVIGAGGREAFLPLAWGTARRQFVSVAGELSFGIAGAVLVLAEPLATFVLAPLVVAVYSAHARLARHLRETAGALETFAAVLDDRDAYTAGHSRRVAELVEELAQALALPQREIVRLRWAARLHDLGKVAVDNSILHKPGKLDPAQWDVLRSHPLLSARILRRFHFAGDEALAVEYHHERYDGHGYFGAADVPLASHFLVVADTYDAMTTDRPYRKGLAPDVALAEIERGLGTQFHPLIGRAFVALRRGEPLDGLLTPGQRQELSELWAGAKPRRARGVRRSPSLEIAVVVLAVAFAATAAAEQWPVVAAFGVAALAGAAALRRRERHADALARRLELVLSADEPLEARLERVVAELGTVGRIVWARLIGPRHPAGGRLARSTLWRFGDGPDDVALLGWLQRDGESHAVAAGESELLGGARCFALPLGASGADEHHLVVALPKRSSARAAAALLRCGRIAAPLDPSPASEQLVLAS